MSTAGWGRQARKAAIAFGFITILGSTNAAFAATQQGAVGIQGTIPGNPPTRGATIAVPGNGSVFGNIPITVSGLCPAGLLVKVFANNVFMGATTCTGGNYSVQIDLFSGRNDLVARVYDALDQAGPDSNQVSVTFNDAQFQQFGEHVIISSAYAQRGTPPGTELQWPISISNGTAPYALSVDWGDGTAADLISLSGEGPVTLKHKYRTAGIYKVIIKVTDKNGQSAFLQVVGQATGAIQNVDKKGDKSTTIVERDVLWWPALIMIPLLFASFWAGRHYQVEVLKKSSGY